MAVGAVERGVPGAQAPVERVSCLENLRQKVAAFVLSRWMLVIAAGLLGAACFGVLAGLAVGSVALLVALVVKKETPEVVQPAVPAQPAQGVAPVPAPAPVVGDLRAHNVRVFQETLQAIREGQRIDRGVHERMLGRVQRVEPFGAPLAPPANPVQTQFVVQPWTTYAMTQWVIGQGHPMPLVLDMANAYVAGGGVVRGAQAQEETLCRQSDLYPALERAVYPLPEHGGLFVPDVQFFRNDNYEFIAPFRAAVFVSAAYNSNRAHGGGYDRPADENAYEAGMKEKMRTMFRTARLNGFTALVLSAFGCGAFRNRPDRIAPWYRDVLNEPEFRGAFNLVAFGVYDREGVNGHNYQVFNQVFG